MALDPSIILNLGRGVTPLKSPGDIQDEQMEREVSGMKLSQLRQGMQDDQTYRNVLQSGAGEDLADRLYKAGLPKQAMETQKFRNEQQTSAATQGKAAIDAMKWGANAILSDPTEENALATLNQLKLPPQMIQTAKERILAAAGDPSKIKQLAAGWGADADKVLGKFESVNLGGTQQQQRTNPLTGELQVAGVQQRTQTPDSIASTASSAATRAQSETNSLRTDARSRELNATKAEEARIKREAKDDTANLTKSSQIASFDTMLGTLDRLAAHPGLSRSVGLVGALPTMPGSDSANFQAELNTFQSQAFIPMVAQLKGMGALSDAEGKKLTAAVGALDPKMGEKAFRDSVKRITDDMNAARNRMTGGNAAAKAGGPQKIAVGTVDEGYRYKGGDPKSASSWEQVK